MPLLALLLAASVSLTTNQPNVCHVEAPQASCDVASDQQCVLELETGAEALYISGCVSPFQADVVDGRRYRIEGRRPIYDNPLPVLIEFAGIFVGVPLLIAGLAKSSAGLDVAGGVTLVGGVGLGLAIGITERRRLTPDGVLIQETAPPPAARGASLLLRF